MIEQGKLDKTLPVFLDVASLVGMSQDNDANPTEPLTSPTHKAAASA